MDYSQISAIAAAVAAAKQLGEAALGIRDFNQLSGTVVNLNAQLLKAQEGLLAHNAELLQLQHEHFQACEKLRKLEEAIRDRGRYSLVEVTAGQFAYRAHVVPQDGGTGEPLTTEPAHYVCQSCFDNGRKVVLQSGSLAQLAGRSTVRVNTWHCVVCNRHIRR
mgnify:FL=1